MATRTITISITGNASDLGRATRDAERDLQSLDRKVETSGGMFDGFGSKLASIGKAAAVGFGGLALGAGAALGFGTKIASDMEQARIGFTTMLGSAEKADAFIKDMQAFAAKTPFEFAGLQESASKLLAVGVEANKVIPIMTVLGDATSAVGTGEEGIQRAVMALGQMQQKGKVTGEEMLQLVEAGIPAWDALASKLGVDVATAQDMVSKGQVKVNDLFAALETSAGPALQKVKGMMDAQSESLKGMWSTLKDVVSMKLSEEAVPLVGALKEILPVLSEVMGELLAPLGDVAAALTRTLGPVLEAIIPVVATLINTLGAGLTTVMQALVPIIQTLAPPLQSVLEVVSVVVTLLVQALAPVLQQILAAITPLLPVIAELAGTVLVALAAAIIPVVQALVPFIAQLVAELTPVLRQIMPIIAELIRELGTELLNAIKDLMPDLMELVRALLPIIPPLVDIIAWLIKLTMQTNDLTVPVLKVMINVVTWLGEVIGKVLNAEWSKLPELLAAGWNEIWNFLTGLPGRMVEALGDIGNLLVGSGRAMIEGLWNGIVGALPWLKDRIGGALGELRKLFPSSPALEGPFSGSGYTDVSGQHLAEDFALGILSRVGVIRAAAQQAMSSAQLAIQTGTSQIAAAAREALSAIGSVAFFEDFSFRGQSGSYEGSRKKLLEMFKFSHPNFDFNAGSTSGIRDFLERVATGRPYFHTGGTYRAARPGGEGLAWLRDGERVSTPSAASAGVTVNIQGLVGDPREAGRLVVAAIEDYRRGGGRV